MSNRIDKKTLNWKKQNKPLIRQRDEILKAKEPFDYEGLVVLNDVSYTYSPNTPFAYEALKDTNLKIAAKKITCVIGTTGSGKSTLIQLLNGLIIPQTGNVLVGNYPIVANAKKLPRVKELRRQMGLVFQFPEYQLFQDTVEKDIAFGPIAMGESKLKAIEQVPHFLEMVGLPKEMLLRSPFELSGGQKRRVAIAGILAMQGSTLILDEPTGGLDPQGEIEFMNLFQKLHDVDGKRIIMVTHNMDQVLKIADEVIVMHNGDALRVGSPFEIFADEQFLNEMGLEPPKLYQLIYALKAQGVDLSHEEIRTPEAFAKAFKSWTKTHKKK